MNKPNQPTTKSRLESKKATLKKETQTVSKKSINKPKTLAGITQTQSKVLLAIGALAIAGIVYKANNCKGESTNNPYQSAQTTPNEGEQTVGNNLKITKIEPISFKSTSDFERQLEFQEYWKNNSLTALKEFKDADPDMPKIIEYMEKNAFYSIPIGETRTQHVGQGDDHTDMSNPHLFEIVFMPEVYARRMRSSILTESSGKTMRIASNFKIQQWLGIMLAHEMSHIYDLNIKGENPHDPVQYAAGEVRAHLLEMNLLKAWSPKAYATLLEKGIPLFRGRKYAEVDQLSKSLYPLQKPLVSRYESSLGLASTTMTIAFEEALQRGATKNDLAAVYQYVVSKFSKAN